MSSIRDKRPSGGYVVIASTNEDSGFVSGLTYEEHSIDVTLARVAKEDEAVRFSTESDAHDFISGAEETFALGDKFRQMTIAPVTPTHDQIIASDYMAGVANGLAVASKRGELEFVVVGNRIMEFACTSSLSPFVEEDIERHGKATLYANLHLAERFAANGGAVFRVQDAADGDVAVERVESGPTSTGDMFLAVNAETAAQNGDRLEEHVVEQARIQRAHREGDLWRCREAAAVDVTGEVVMNQNPERYQFVKTNQNPNGRDAEFERLAERAAASLPSVFLRGDEKGIEGLDR